MRNTVLLTVAVGLGVATTAARAQGPAPEDSVRAAERARRDALLAADTVALGRLVAPAFFEITRFGTLRTRADNLGELATGNLKLQSLEHDSLDVRIYGDVAVLTGIARQTGTYRGMAFTGQVRYLRVFVRREGRWQAVAMQHTSLSR
jgi:hypothetical protein